MTTSPGPSARSDIWLRRRVTLLTWVVLGLVPVLWVIELTGPRWLNLALRGLWVVLAVATVAVGLWMLVRARGGRRPSADR